jgi:hypothetical protein
MVTIRITSPDGSPANTQITLPCGTPIPLVDRIDLSLSANGAGWEGYLQIAPSVLHVESVSVRMKEFLVAAITTVPRGELEAMRTAIEERLAGLDPLALVDQDAQTLFAQAFHLAKKACDPAAANAGDATRLAATVAELRARVEARTLPIGPDQFDEAEKDFLTQLANLTPEGIEAERARVQLNLAALAYIKRALLPAPGDKNAGCAIALTHRFEDVAPEGMTMTANFQPD